MKAQLKILMLMFVSLFVLVGSAFASPINAQGLDVTEVNGEYVVLLTMSNANVASGDASRLVFTVEELGTSKDMGYVVVNTNDSVTKSYNLADVTNSFNSLKKGSVYTVTAALDGTSMSKSFQFGSVADNEGLDLLIESVRVNGADVSSTNTLEVVNGETLDLSMVFTALANFDNARLMISLDGYEHSTITANTQVFAAKEGVQYIKSMSINLPADMDSERTYILRIYGSSDLSGLTYKEYTLYVNTERHRVDVLDLVMTPSAGVEAGQNLVANVRMKNRGQKAQDSVKVTVAVPALGIYESSYVTNLNKADAATSDDMLLYVPEGAQAGQYQATVTLSYNSGYTQTTQKFMFNVLAPTVVEEAALMLSVPSSISLEAGDVRSFEVVVANPGRVSKPISIAAVENTWSVVEVSPSLAMVQGGDSSVYTIKVKVDEDVEEDKVLNLIVKDGASVVKTISLNVDVKEASNDNNKSEDKSESGINWVKVLLVILLIIAVIVLLSLLVAIFRRNGRKSNDYEDNDYASTEEYY